MTPEERAEEVNDRLAAEMLEPMALGDHKEIVSIIAAAIRAAEADMRERCAQVAEGLVGKPLVTAREVVAAIRALS